MVGMPACTCEEFPYCCGDSSLVCQHACAHNAALLVIERKQKTSLFGVILMRSQGLPWESWACERSAAFSMPSFPSLYELHCVTCYCIPGLACITAAQYQQMLAGLHTLHNAAPVGHGMDEATLACPSGLGAFEYFQLAEELNAEPVWVINNGISHTYSVPADQIWPLVQVLGTIPSSSIYQLASRHVDMCFIIYTWTAALLPSITNCSTWVH